MIRHLISHFFRIYREHGITHAVGKSVHYVKRYVANGFGAYRYQLDKRVDTQERFELLNSHLGPAHQSLLDIGCADGFLTHKFAETEMFAIGVDVSEANLGIAQSKYTHDTGVAFTQFEVNPKTVDCLPRTDVVLLLTVYHHWCDAFGFEHAEEMLTKIVDNSTIVFFEPPGRELDRPKFDGYENETVKGYYQSYLEHILDEEVKVVYLDTVDYVGGERKDPIFKIES